MTLTLQQFFDFADSDPRGPFPKLTITVEQARELRSEILMAMERDSSFDLVRHMKPRQTINVLHSTCEKLRGHPERSVL